MTPELYNFLNAPLSSTDEAALRSAGFSWLLDLRLRWHAIPSNRTGEKGETGQGSEPVTADRTTQSRRVVNA